jgi:molybdopterin-guanine dinucleotide biosynthesis protein MobB
MSGLLGAILAGGQGRRMGGPKEGVAVPGGTLLSRTWNAVAPTASRVVLQGPSTAPAGLHASQDRRMGAGPLAGLETALLLARESGSAGAVVLAVDLPRVTAPILLDLVRRWRELPDPEGGAVVPRTRRGLQPLAGVYGAGLADTIGGWIEEGGGLAARDWVVGLGDRVRIVPAGELDPVGGHPEPFLNVNSPAHVERALDLPPTAPPLISVAGWKDVGKTSVAVGLVRELRARGYRVMALKHGHHFRLDTPGTDSHRLRHESGADRVLLAGPDEMALMGHWGDRGEPRVAQLAARYLSDADVVVVEGWKREPLPAIEISRGGVGGRDPLWKPGSSDGDRFIARVIRGDPEVEAVAGPPVFDADDAELFPGLAQLVEERVIPGVRWSRVGEGEP